MLTREELRQKLWPADTFVDFDNGLNTAIKKLRDTLGDSADSPRFIETLPKRGYRFIYPVNGANAASEAQALRPMIWWRRPWAAGLLALTALLAAGLASNVGGLRDRITTPSLTCGNLVLVFAKGPRYTNRKDLGGTAGEQIRGGLHASAAIHPSPHPVAGFAVQPQRWNWLHLILPTQAQQLLAIVSVLAKCGHAV